MGALEDNYPPVAAEKLPEADAIVLLGGAIRGKTSNETLADMSGVGDRLVFAVAAFKASKAPRIIVTGGAPDGDDPEAALMRDILVTMGIPDNKIILETRNRVTLDSREYLPETLQSIGANSILLVTSAFHMRRALWVFGPLDVEVIPAPTDHQVLLRAEEFNPLFYMPNAKALQLTTWAFHEALGYIYYNVRG
ncbi:MAG: YdcF family protein [Halioglobus sp.]